MCVCTSVTAVAVAALCVRDRASVIRAEPGRRKRRACTAAQFRASRPAVTQYLESKDIAGERQRVHADVQCNYRAVVTMIFAAILGVWPTSEYRNYGRSDIIIILLSLLFFSNIETFIVVKTDVRTNVTRIDMHVYFIICIDNIISSDLSKLHEKERK